MTGILKMRMDARLHVRLKRDGNALSDMSLLNARQSVEMGSCLPMKFATQEALMSAPLLANLSLKAGHATHRFVRKLLKKRMKKLSQK